MGRSCLGGNGRFLEDGKLLGLGGVGDGIGSDVWCLVFGILFWEGGGWRSLEFLNHKQGFRILPPLLLHTYTHAYSRDLEIPKSWP